MPDTDIDVSLGPLVHNKALRKIATSFAGLPGNRRLRTALGNG